MMAPHQQQYGSTEDAQVSDGKENHQYRDTIVAGESLLTSLFPKPPQEIDPSPMSIDQKFHRCHSCGQLGSHEDEDIQLDEEDGKGKENSNYFSKHIHCRTRTAFWEDAKNMEEGTIPHSIIVGLIVGITCGCAVFLYYKVLFILMGVAWKELPKMFVMDQWPEHLQVLWIPLVLFVTAIGTGLSVSILGDPGDLAYIVKCVHAKGYITIDHLVPMVFASLFSMVGGGPIGPEPPLVAICACIAGFISRNLFKQRNRNMIRKHTLMGMGAALAALFGCPLGGPLFALEVNSRFGIEYFEHTVETVFSATVSVMVMRFLSGGVMESIWSFSDVKLANGQPTDILLGAALGLLGALVTTAYGAWLSQVLKVFDYLGLLDNKFAVRRALLATCFIAVLGMLIPQVLFWGELEFTAIATMAPSSSLPYAWPTPGLIGFEMNSGLNAFIVGVAKMVTISFAVAGGYRGGVIFPFFAAGAAFGRCFTSIFPSVNVPLATLCFAAGIEVSFLRTVLSTPIILCYLSGEQQAMAGVLSASLVSVFATSYIPFIKTQTLRNDLDSNFSHTGRQSEHNDSKM
mmetsp:Transcript_14059/g.25381  ORF Transcript_14059/g.25381 Transcript_14059/m.25381 type:complete len:572 (-) Transcript_14059:182-1897(-)